MIIRLASRFEQFTGRWIPDTFVLTILLTVVAFAATILFTGHSIVDLAGFWGDGLWSLLAFSMQIVLILVTGHAIASAAPVARLFHTIAEWAKTPRQAVMLVTVVAAICCWLNPGFGLVGGALFAKAMGDRMPGANYPLLIASAYSGYVIWHGGLSGTVPLQIAAPGDDALGALLSAPVPMSQTVFSMQNIALCVVLLVTLSVLNMLMVGQNEARETAPCDSASPSPSPPQQATSPAQRIDNSVLISAATALLCGFYLVTRLWRGGVISFNTINLILITIGLLLHRGPRNYVDAVARATGSVSGVILQYPFYGGIMGLLATSGLAAMIANWFVAISSQHTYLILTFLGAGFLNIFIPSGGGQWAVQAPVVIESAKALGMPISSAAMAVAYGDAWTNLIQPFWTLPILAVSGLSLKDILGFCLITCLWSGLVFAAFLYFVF